jgi:hypothetical protein
MRPSAFMRLPSRVSSVVARAALVVAAVCCVAPASGQIVQQPVDPKIYASSSGTFAFAVDPSDVYGRHGATYRLNKHGKEVWSKAFPFTLFGAAITETGIVAGYGYTFGEWGGQESEGPAQPGDMVVAIVDASGSLRLKQVIKRWPSAGIQSRPLPSAYGLIVDEPNDRLVVRLEDFGHYESWRTYRLSTGAVLEKRTPRRWMDDMGRDMEIGDVRLIRGTPLILMECCESDLNRQPKIYFRLVDPEAKPVWSLARNDDGVVRTNAPDRARMQHWIDTHGYILRNDQPRQWDALLAAGTQRVTFAVELSTAGKWLVKEVARVPFALPPEEPKRETQDERPLKERGTIVLQAAGAADQSTRPSRLGRFAAITIDNRGRFIAVDARSGSIHIFDAAGKLLHVGPSLPAAVQAESPQLATDDHGQIYLGLEESDHPDGKRAYACFSAAGERQKNVLLPASRSAFQPGSGLILAIGQTEVRLINDRGRTVRTIQRRSDHRWLQSPQAVAVAPDGSLAILARRLIGMETTINLYRANGDAVCMIRLPESAGGFPKFAYNGRRLVVAGDNRLLIYDAAGKLLSSGPPPLEIPDGLFYYSLILPDGRELALYDGKKPVLHRFDMP